jgi:hypothetical protein
MLHRNMQDPLWLLLSLLTGAKADVWRAELTALTALSFQNDGTSVFTFVVRAALQKRIAI